MDILNTLLFGHKYGTCIFCGDKTKLSDSVFYKDNACVCRKCNNSVKTTPFSQFYKSTEYISFFIAPLNYSGVVKNAVHSLKFKFTRSAAYCLAYYINICLSVMADEISLNRFDMLVPVPLSRLRLKERGYNQAELIAQCISEYFHIPVKSDALIKYKNTKPQSLLSHDKRHTNVQNSYVSKADISGKNILLIDDVCTTGNTLNACAKALKENGAGIIGAVTAACVSGSHHSSLYNEFFS